MARLLVNAVTKHFAHRNILNAVQLDVPAGSLTALLGPSGGGKTTLLRLICGFERADAGQISIGEQIVSAPGLHLPPERRCIGYVPQEGALFPHLSVANNISFGLPRAQRKAQYRVAELLELVGLNAGFAQRAPQQLSGGEQQRVALARALAPKPALVLLDEPFSALDAALRTETRLAAAHALQQAGATAILVTHDQAEALSMGQQVAVLWGGQMAQVAAPAELYRNPVNRDIAAFVGDAVWLPGVPGGDGMAQTALGRIALANAAELPGNTPLTLLLRPEQIKLQAPGLAGAAAAMAVVKQVQFFGAETRLTLGLLGSDVVLLARSQLYVAAQVGDVLAVAVEGPARGFV